MAKPSKSKFTGVAHSVECFEHGGFRNFKILTLHLEDGEVVRVDRSDPYANFEAIAKLEVLVHNATLDLNFGWEHGKVWGPTK